MRLNVADPLSVLIRRRRVSGIRRHCRVVLAQDHSNRVRIQSLRLREQAISLVNLASRLCVQSLFSERPCPRRGP
jgi:hypothetical protein